MKKLALLSLAVIVSMGCMFGQMKIQPSKTVVVILGKKNPTLDEAKFPDIKFYYTPGLTLKDNGGIYGKKSKNKKSNAWSSALGMGSTSHSEAVNEFEGTPEELVEAKVGSGYAFIFDKNGVVAAKRFASGSKAEFYKSTEFMVSFNKMQRKWESETFDKLMKDLVKKGDTTKPGKASKKPEHKYEIGYGINSAMVEDKDGNKKDITEIIKGDPATLLVFLYVSPDYDLEKAKESGKGKKGKDYSNDVAQAIAAGKQISPLYNLEEGIYGKRIER